MPTRPLSHEQRQRQARAQTAEAKAQRQAANHDYVERRKAIHGRDPRSGSGRWFKLRRMKLARNPLCEDPYQVHSGEPVPATQVDHIQGIWDRPDLIFDMETNLQSLCAPCHGRKSGEERRRNKA
jgi:hypothetical protein